MSTLLSLKINLQWSDETIGHADEKTAIILVDTLWASTAIATAFSKQKDVLQVSDLNTFGSNNLISVLPKFSSYGCVVLTAAFVNASSTVDYLMEQQFEQLIFIPIGTYVSEHKGVRSLRKSIEDYFAAAFMVRLIEKRTGILFDSIRLHRRLIDNEELLLGELKSTEFVQYLLHNSKITASNVEHSFTIDCCPVVCEYVTENNGTFRPVH
jgi:phosphosulfolactate phosphohydrolase-like enzyme